MAIRKENIKGKDWQSYRSSLVTIGGSDASCILGLNPYKSAYALWCEKTGKIIPEDISDKEAVRLGNDLEQCGRALDGSYRQEAAPRQLHHLQR